MKKLLSVILTVSLSTAALTGCAVSTNQEKSDSNDEKIRVVAVNFPQYDFVRQLAGDLVDLQLLVQPGTEVHDYDPSPQDLIAVQECDLLIYIGGESDSWVEDILGSTELSQDKIFSMMDCVDKYFEETQEGMTEHKEEEGEEYDEHVWTSPKNAIKIVDAICKKLSAIDNENASTYEKNRLDYVRSLSTLDNHVEEIVANAKEKTLIFGDRFPFLYFVRAYGLDYYAAFPGCSEDSEPTAATLSFLIDKVKEEKISTVFYIEQSDQKTADIICEETGAEKLLFHSCHNVTKAEFDEGVTYLQLMEKNVENLREALK
ncbi:MAG: metal ABC transporter substrate-binding protein [Acutalibacteraceae bacterium]